MASTESIKKAVSKKTTAEYRQEYRARGLCISCGKREPKPTSTVCEHCTQASTRNSKRRKQAARRAGKCSHCCKRKPLEGRGLCQACRDYRYRSSEQRLHLRLRRYNLTPAQYQAILAEQAGCCAICQEQPVPPAPGLAIDHCHNSTRVRGLLCHKCNRALGLFGDDTVKLHAAIAYLEAHAEGD
jgi:hypothetical protein